MFIGNTWYDFSQAASPTPNASVALQQVYTVRADPTYDIGSAPGVVYEGCVAVRTIGGEGRVWLHDAPAVTLEEDTLFLCRADAIGRYACSGDRWDFWWVEFNTSSALPLALERKYWMGERCAEEDVLQRCLTLLFEEDDRAHALSSSLFSAQLHEWAMQSRSERERRRSHGAVNAAIKAMHESLGQNLSVSQMARDAALGERRFRQVFAELTGQTPKRYYERLRLAHAKHLLRWSSLSVSEVAENLGYSSPYYFSNAFFHAYQIRPSRYRESRKSSQ